MRDFLVDRDPAVAEVIDGTSRAASMFVDPTGTQIGDTLQNEEGIAYAEFDLNKCIEPKQFHDVVGYYNRFDVFSLGVERRRHEPVAWSGPSDPKFPRLLDDEMTARVLDE
jgi:aliphatic nitrilase